MRNPTRSLGQRHSWLRHPLLLALPFAAIAALAAAAVPPPNLERAVAAQRALAQKQPTAEVWNDLGNLLQLGGHNDEARAAYEQALQRDPKLVSAHYNLGLLLRQAGEERQAAKHFEEVVELEPGHAWGWFQLAALAEARGSDRTAVDAYARAYALDPRLSFSDVNPQVIDSKLTTEALLRAEKERPAATEAPRAYEDPGHIAKLLLPGVPAPAATPSPAAGEPAVAAAPATSGTPGTPKLPADQHVLSPQDLRAGGAGNQAGGVTATGPGGQPRQPQPSPAYSDLLRQQLELQQEQQRQLEGGEPAQDAPEGVYVPGVRSSGQVSQTIEEWR
ncbi:MAG TPA: tetratricopeptide repeat protein, partial [Thermoanaerobaculia bacterium]|nr:tetratricopeptide repeat protein [Thermoanaerobaculia bacterium]